MFQFNWKFYSTKARYTRLFIDLILLFFLVPLANFSPILRTLINLFFLITILLAIDTLSFSRRTLFLFRIIAAIAFGADIIAFPNYPLLTELTDLLSYSFYCAFIILAIMAIASRIIDEERVNMDVIRGAICIYFLLGIVWFFFYRIILLFDSAAFTIPAIETEYRDLFYFSFITLTTVGYGDISPVNAFAMTFANAEAIVGQIFPAIFLARLVSLYTKDSKK